MSPRTRMGAAAAAVVTLMASMLASCSSDGGAEAAPAELSLWVRAANEAKTQAVADAYNADHETQIRVTAFPDDQFVTRVATAASSNQLPDILASDSAHMPTFISSEIYLDITDRVEALPFADTLFEPLMDVATSESRIYAVPRDPGNSMLFWNKDLYRQAGLDPEAAPTTWAEIAEHARAVQDAVPGASGVYIPGNCAGCIVFPWLPMVWATGGDVFDADGLPTLDDPGVIAGLEFYRGLVADGLNPASAQTDTGTDWFTAFTAGTVGILPIGSFAISAMRQGNPDLDFGVAPLPGQDGGTSSWVGGDVVGVTSSSDHPDAAWDFVAWTLSEEVQVGIVAAANELVARTDLVENEYSQGDPAVLTSNNALAVARTPQSRYFQQIVNDPNGPFATMFYEVLYGGADPATAAREAQVKAEAIVEQQG